MPTSEKESIFTERRWLPAYTLYLLIFYKDVTVKENNVDNSNELDLTGKRILVVDDVEINREILFMQLEETGAICDGAANGKEAVTLFNQNQYALVLMDLHMPVMDGLCATRNIRASSQPWASTVPIISVTAENNAEILSKCEEAGINHILSKPIEIEILYSAIKKFIV